MTYTLKIRFELVHNVHRENVNPLSLWPPYFLWYQLGEFAQASRHFMFGDHFLCPCDLYV